MNHFYAFTYLFSRPICLLDCRSKIAFPDRFFAQNKPETQMEQNGFETLEVYCDWVYPFTRRNSRITPPFSFMRTVYSKGKMVQPCEE